MLDLDDFLGDWRMARRIEDAHMGQAGHFAGTAHFASEGAGIRYREAGRLRMGDGPVMTASREYLWERDDGGIAVRFADGRPFHRFEPAGRVEGSEHPCGHDLYRVAYDFAGWPGWGTSWVVTGPAKAYRMRTDYVRA